MLENTAVRSKFVATCLGVMAAFLGSAAAQITLSGQSQKQPLPGCAPASREAASELLLRHFPNAEFISFEGLSSTTSETGCLLEVEMLADKDEPQTKGFVYVLPDGKGFLNGPLLDKRSRLSIVPGVQAGQAAPHAPSAAATANVQPAGQPPLQGQTPPALDPLEKALSSVEALPAIHTQLTGHPVYVLFDPQCIYCHDLYAQHEKLAQKYDLQFIWVPVFLNERSWAMSAHLLKTAEADAEKARGLLEKMMLRTWSPHDDAADIQALGDADYAKAKVSALAFYEISQQIQGAGTPLVIYRAPNGSASVINGLPRPDDWLAFQPK